MKRRNFTDKTKAEAFLRARGRCQASGPKYGMDAMVVCNKKLDPDTVEYDHLQECREEGDNSLENCVPVCRECHQIKTNIVRAQCDKADRLAGRKEKTRSKSKWPKRPMDGTKASGVRKRMDGTVERREPK